VRSACRPCRQLAPVGLRPDVAQPLALTLPQQTRCCTLTSFQVSHCFSTAQRPSLPVTPVDSIVASRTTFLAQILPAAFNSAPPCTVAAVHPCPHQTRVKMGRGVVHA
jgi:hypothetical protein